MGALGITFIVFVVMYLAMIWRMGREFRRLAEVARAGFPISTLPAEPGARL
jgi:hypothetical protein